jgi:DNA invertase Pin-like site-specific DNA recombinase
MRCALYARVSTQGQNNDNQLAELRKFAATQGWQVVAEYADHGISGSTANRTRFQAMFQAASKREFDVLLFWSLDRLSREGVLETLRHLERLTSYGIQWRSLTEQYLDSTGIFRDAVISILAVIAKQERVRRSERVRAGLARVRSTGQRLGRPGAVVNVDAARKQIAAGNSLRSVARGMGVSAALLCKRLQTA